nr:hypothetical protein [uncultured Oscillibacter sp.]
MKKRGEKKNASWWTYALTAVLWMLSALIRVGSMVRQGRADGMSVLLVLVFLVDAVVFAVRAVRAFRQQGSDKKMTEDDNMIDGGTIHD